MVRQINQKPSPSDEAVVQPSFGQIALLAIKLVGLTLLLSVLYIAIRTTLKPLPRDVLHLSAGFIQLIHTFEPLLFGLWVIPFVIFYGIYSFRQLRVSKKILNEVHASKYSEESKRLDTNIKSIVEDLLQGMSTFYEINDKPRKTVYAITGNWRSGKTTTAGHMIDLLRKETKIKWGGEYYHDTFNFGNINESIHSFFNNIALLTKIDEFKHLARTATPQSEISLSVGPIKFPNVFAFNQDLRSLRKKIHDKLKGQGRTYIIVLDDIDRLLPTEQLQWLRTIELLGKFRGSLLLVIPVNYLEVTRALDKSEISEKYLEKILPNVINVGVDIDFIMRELGVNGDPSPEIARKYSKYLYCLAIRMCLAKLNSNTSVSRTSWEHDFAGGLISKTAMKFKDGLYVPQSTGITFNLGPNSEYQVGSSKQLWFNNGDLYNSHQIMKIPYYYFLAPSADSNDIEVAAVRTVEVVLDINTLQQIFEQVRFKYVDRPSIKPNGYSADSTAEVNFWETIGYSIVKNLESDPAISTYFTYDIISKELKGLLAIDESQEAEFLIELTRSGKTA
jgi:hypothetical protein